MALELADLLPAVLNSIWTLVLMWTAIALLPPLVRMFMRGVIRLIELIEEGW